MASLSDLPLKYRAFMRLYPYRHVEWRPAARLDKPLQAARVATVTSAGYYLPHQLPFDESVRGGDWSYRVIDAAAPVETLRLGNRSDAFDSSGINRDKNLALPLDRLRELALARSIGSVAPRHFSIMGSIAAPGQLVSRTAREIAAALRHDEVDAVLLVPV